MSKTKVKMTKKLIFFCYPYNVYALLACPWLNIWSMKNLFAFNTKNSKAAVCSFYEAVERTCIGTCKNDHRSYWRVVWFIRCQEMFESYLFVWSRVGSLNLPHKLGWLHINLIPLHVLLKTDKWLIFKSEFV